MFCAWSVFLNLIRYVQLYKWKRNPTVDEYDSVYLNAALFEQKFPSAVLEKIL